MFYILVAVMWCVQSGVCERTSSEKDGGQLTADSGLLTASDISSSRHRRPHNDDIDLRSQSPVSISTVKMLNAKVIIISVQNDESLREHC